MQIFENAKLAPYTTFYIGGPSRYLIFAQDQEEVIEAIQFARQRQLPYFIFGGGSNLLICDEGFGGVAIRVETVGIDIVGETNETITLRAASGEVWDDVVRLAAEENWWGIENLSHIPGFTGAVCIQNVGAYGQEVADVVEGVETYDTETNQIVTLSKNELDFGYRSSIFNTTKKHRYVILNTILRLSKVAKPNISYGDLVRQLSGRAPSIGQIREAVIEVRNQKFPFPSSPDKGNAGSFFRGPLLSEAELEHLKQVVAATFPEAAEKFAAMTDKLKVAQGFKTPAAFLIELCGLKGTTIGGAKINPSQPAVIVNFTGHATSSDVLTLYKEVSSEVYDKTGVKLGIEPELICYN